MYLSDMQYAQYRNKCRLLQINKTGALGNATLKSYCIWSAKYNWTKNTLLDEVEDEDTENQRAKRETAKHIAGDTQILDAARVKGLGTLQMKR